MCLEAMNMPLNELNDLLHETTFRFPQNLLGCITVSLVNALEHCHSKGVAHRDVKPGNILFKANGEIKLADFSEASDVIEDNKFAGTICYMAPERLNMMRLELQ
uniref:mitogen-activated protein kinase kinase n=1 Tax=Acrobeloides nanus TaxID=290746 RepID=A0A914C8W3_9BILA